MAELGREREIDCWAKSPPLYENAADIRGRSFRIQPRCASWKPHDLPRPPAARFARARPDAKRRGLFPNEATHFAGVVSILQMDRRSKEKLRYGRKMLPLFHLYEPAMPSSPESIESHPKGCKNAAVAPSFSVASINAFTKSAHTRHGSRKQEEPAFPIHYPSFVKISPLPKAAKSPHQRRQLPPEGGSAAGNPHALSCRRYRDRNTGR